MSFCFCSVVFLNSLLCYLCFDVFRILMLCFCCCVVFPPVVFSWCFDVVCMVLIDTEQCLVWLID